MSQLAVKVKSVRLIAVLVIVAFACSCNYIISPYVDRELSGLATLKPEWLELNPKEPLKLERDTQELTLYPDPPIQMVYDPTGKRSLIPVDDRDAEIEAELIGSNGINYRSEPGVAESMTGNLQVTSRSLRFKDLPKDITYNRVRIKSSVAYPVKKILWRCYDWSDVHD